MTNLERGRLARYRQSGSDFRRPAENLPMSVPRGA